MLLVDRMSYRDLSGLRYIKVQTSGNTMTSLELSWHMQYGAVHVNHSTGPASVPPAPRAALIRSPVQRDTDRTSQWGMGRDIGRWGVRVSAQVETQGQPNRARSGGTEPSQAATGMACR